MSKLWSGQGDALYGCVTGVGREMLSGCVTGVGRGMFSVGVSLGWTWECSLWCVTGGQGDALCGCVPRNKVRHSGTNSGLVR
jgi:hypothetical protein